ncbi:YaaL family protein [Konateibacter massiliensis]|uniref:YaaL family protein n=1 Tax=Konateibacter massiliensis TaxID=2002841 RepID=UPI001F2B4C88|nr:YaaL family protein [Konateibacter massiliensis]
MIKEFLSNIKIIPPIKDEAIALQIYHNKERLSLLSDLERAKVDLDVAYSNFENVVDPDLIDSCIYELNAVQKKYKFLYERVKQHELEKFS